MEEIGGYIELEQATGREYYSDLIAVNSGRNALLYILKAKKIKKLYIPYYLCDSIWIVCEDNHIEYEFYHIDRDFLPSLKESLSENEYIYIVNYFGMLSKEVQRNLKELYKNIIWDNCQAFFNEPEPHIDTVYTCRKYFGVPDGGYVYTDCLLDEELKQDESRDRMLHLLGRYEAKGSKYYNEYRRHEEQFIGLPLKSMSRITHNILSYVDYEMVKSKREENFLYLHKKLSGINGFALERMVAPFAYPLYVPNGVELKRRLIEKNIYVPTLWPEVKKCGNEIECDYVDNILPLPCDQRYGIEDMIKICKCIFEEQYD